MVKIIWLILLVAHVETRNKIIKYEYTEENSENEKRFHEELIEKLFQQKQYRGVLLYNEDNKSEYCCKFLEYFQFQQMPTLVITEHRNFTYANHFNKDVLCVACVNFFDGSTLQQLANLFDYMRYTRVLAVMEKEPGDLYATVLRGFFQRARQLKMLNVAVIFKDFFTTRKFFQYTIFPEFKLQLGEYKPQSVDFALFPERLTNLYGYKLRTIADHTEPRAIEYYNKRHEKILSGYIGRFVQAISDALNATLYFPLDLPHDVILDYRQIMDYVVNISLDIPASSVSVMEGHDLRDYSYTFEIAKWCFLLPVEKSIKVEELFFMVIHSPIIVITLVFMVLFTIMLNFVLRKRRLSWPQILVNDMAIRGALGQASTRFIAKTLSSKLIYGMLLLSGIVNGTVFLAHFQTLLTHLPLEHQIKTYPDLFKAPYRLAISEAEFKYLHKITNGSLAYLYPKCYNLSDFVKFIHFRDNLDQRFAYPTISTKMYYYNGLQDFYGRRIFRFSKDLCPEMMAQLKFPLGPNSVFQSRLDDIILKSLETGLINYWISKSFADMQESGKAIRLNIGYPQEAKPLQINDLYWIWFYLATALGLSCAVFILELIIDRVQLYFK